MSEFSKHSVLSSGGLLALAALLGTALLWLTSWHAEAYIMENERQALLSSLNAVIPANSYDNDLLEDTIEVTTDDLGNANLHSTIYRARQGNSPTAIAMTTVAADGYSGDILILVGIHENGSISGVRILKHRETPGLGDAIEVERSDWVLGFNNKSLVNPFASQWKVKKDGGEFDQFTGATITPRAVVKAIHLSLEFYAKHKQALFKSPSHQMLSLGAKPGVTS